MFVGAVSVPIVVGHAVWEVTRGRHVDVVTDHLFTGIGLALAVAAVVELAYTLFTHGADEALDPLMLGVSAALLIQLGRVKTFEVSDGVAVILYILGLCVLFAIREHLAKVSDPEDFWTWRESLGNRNKRSSDSAPATTPNVDKAADQGPESMDQRERGVAQARPTQQQREPGDSDVLEGSGAGAGDNAE
jgi:hypothetical protein